MRVLLWLLLLASIAFPLLFVLGCRAWLIEVAYESDLSICDLVAAGESYIARITHRTTITRQLSLEAVE